MAKRKAKAVATVPLNPPDGVMSMEVNGHALSGESRGGRWTFTCPSWPDLAAKYEGAATFGDVMPEFMGRALLGAVTIKRIAEGS